MVSGPCTVAEGGRCVGRQDGYLSNEDCTIFTTGSGTLGPCPAFDTSGSAGYDSAIVYDFLEIGTTQAFSGMAWQLGLLVYSGDQLSTGLCPAGVSLPTNTMITWHSDSGQQGGYGCDQHSEVCGAPYSSNALGGGWQVCFSGSQIPPRGIPQWDSVNCAAGLAMPDGYVMEHWSGDASRLPSGADCSTNGNGRTFVLYLLPAQPPNYFSYNAAGAQKYAELCIAAGLRPVTHGAAERDDGTGTWDIPDSGANCAQYDCMPMWVDGNWAATAVHVATGWSDFVTFRGNQGLPNTGADPSPATVASPTVYQAGDMHTDRWSAKLRPVCGTESTAPSGAEKPGPPPSSWNSGRHTNMGGNTVTVFLLPLATFSGHTDVQRYVDLCSSAGLRPLVSGGGGYQGRDAWRDGGPFWCEAPYDCVRGPGRWGIENGGTTTIAGEQPWGYEAYDDISALTGWSDLVLLSPERCSVLDEGTCGGIMNSKDGYTGHTNTGWAHQFHPVCACEGDCAATSGAPCGDHQHHNAGGACVCDDGWSDSQSEGVDCDYPSLGSGGVPCCSGCNCGYGAGSSCCNSCCPMAGSCAQGSADPCCAGACASNTECDRGC